MLCPHDGIEMERVTRHGVTLDRCPTCGGVWLDRGELDHVIEAVRPAVALENPEPEPTTPQPESHGSRYSPPKRKRAVRFEDRGREEERHPGQGKRFGGAFSRAPKAVQEVIEEIFDFD